MEEQTRIIWDRFKRFLLHRIGPPAFTYDDDNYADGTSAGAGDSTGEGGDRLEEDAKVNRNNNIKKGNGNIKEGNGKKDDDNNRTPPSPSNSNPPS